MARRAKGMTLKDLGRRAGASKGYLSGVENEKVGPPMDKLVRKLAYVLGMDRAPLLRAAWRDRMPPDVRKLFGG